MRKLRNFFNFFFGDFFYFSLLGTGVLESKCWVFTLGSCKILWVINGYMVVFGYAIIFVVKLTKDIPLLLNVFSSK
ncbi:hypothetical protein QBC42DRAFT_258355 [Cladorrhinum samala]|uniref:Uncharacterized protein n=1 Tax=Cladorrhinum samala TaxID=585594 RepID=A0AAV9I4L1_9PEZI|nr:hypothetical protein QBC42DRAFT_258355 [Cladorrhinum samala]